MAPGWQHECNPDFSIGEEKLMGFVGKTKEILPHAEGNTSSELPNATLHLCISLKKNNFQWHPEAGQERGAGTGTKGCSGHTQHPIDPPGSCSLINSAFRAEQRGFLTPWEVPSRKGGGSPGLAAVSDSPFPRCCPRRARAELRVTRVLLAWWHLPGAPLGPDFVIELAGHRKGKGGGEAEG